jgi:preprotein translocase subunit SecD
VTSTQKFRLYFLLALCIVSGVIVAPTFLKGQLPDWWPGRPIKLGLDLRGGSYFVLHVKTDEAVKGHLVTLASSLKSELRKEKVGVLRARQEGDKALEVQLLTEEGTEQVDAYLRKVESGLIRVGAESSAEGGKKLRYELNQKRVIEIKKESVEQSIEVVRRRVDQFGVAEPTIQRSGEERILVQLPDVTDISSVRQTIGKLAKLEFRMVVESGSTSGSVEKKRKLGGVIRVEDQARLTGREIKAARIEIDPQTHEIAVNLQFNATGSELFDRITAENVGKRFAIILDDLVYSDPVIRERISQGSASISGGFTKEEAHQLAVVLRSGALPAPLEVGEQRIVGASLGEDSIKSGVMAALVGTALVVVFMFVYYRRSGLQAIACTVVNLLLLLACLSLFGATLTLPGIGGLALTIGMAVDSNIIIFERIRDELRSGSSIAAAIEAGFHKAHWTILDANLTTLLAGIILYTFGTGPIRGFAVTLSLGVVTTVFAALYISKLAYEVVDMTDKDGKLSI